MAKRTGIATIQACIGNRLDAIAVGERRIAGVIGEAPSLQSPKSNAIRDSITPGVLRYGMQHFVSWG